MTEGSEAKLALTNGKFLDGAMLYHDCVAYLVAVEQGIPPYIGSQEGGATPGQVATRFGMSLRATSALLVTLCRMGVVVVRRDSDESVDLITYALSAAAHKFFGNYDQTMSTKCFCQSFTTNFITPEKLLDCCKSEKKDVMSEHLEESDEQQANNARNFMRHMDSQSWSCAEAFPTVLGLAEQPLTLLDVGGGSAIYTIAAARANPHLRGNILELAAIKPITEEYIAAAGLSERISVTSGDFFSEAPFPMSDIVLFANIFHDWPDEINLALIRKAFASLSSGGRIVISELLLGDELRSSSSASTSMNVIMIPWTKGRQYRPKELFRRLTHAGFVRPRVHQLVDDYSLVVAEKP
jgi:hypothetical protein